MRKIILFILTLALVCSLAACSKNSSRDTVSATDDITEIYIEDPAIDGDTEASDESDEESNYSPDLSDLTEAYNSGAWDGSETVLNGKVYCVDDYGYICKKDEDGNLESLYHVDIPANTAYAKRLAWSKDVGLFTYEETGTVALWRHGERLGGFSMKLPEYGEIRAYIIGDDLFAVYYDSNFMIVNHKNEGKEVLHRFDVTDAYENDHVVNIATFDGKNYAIEDAGSLSELATHYTKFPSDSLEGVESQYKTGRYGRIFYVGGYIDDGSRVYLFDNNDGKTYTMVYHDDKTDKIIGENVVDAEYQVGRVDWYDGSSVYFYSIGKGTNTKIQDGTIYYLTPTWSEDDSVQIVK